MKAAREHIEEINRLYASIKKTNSQYLKNDYSKSIYRMLDELKEYCKYKGYSYKELTKLIKS